MTERPGPRRPLEVWCAVALSVLMLGAYLAHPSRLNEVKRLHWYFYSKVFSSGISFSGANVLDAIVSGDHNEWTHWIAKSGWTRLQSPGGETSFDKLHARWEEGVWSNPPREEWLAAYDELQTRWERARARRQEREKAYSPTRIMILGGHIRIAGLSGENLDRFARDDGAVSAELPATGGSVFLYPTGMTTADFGSRITFVFEGDLGRVENTPKLYWSTGDLDLTGYRLVPAEGKEGEVVFDLSRDPAWLVPDQGVEALRVDLPGATGTLTLREIRSGD